MLTLKRGKLFAKKLGIKYICSTTSFAFNKDTAKMMKRGALEVIGMMIGMPRINKKLKLLRKNGYEADNFISLIENNNDTDTIVYTSKEFQPMSETFSDRYYFVGPSVNDAGESFGNKHKTVYISLGTVLNKNSKFYRNCIEAFDGMNAEVIMSVGEKTDITALGKIPDNFQVKDRVNQIKVLSKADVFVTHCGMNSVNESLYYGVPMVLFPQQSEQAMVADRTAALGAGIMLKGNKPEHIREGMKQVLNNGIYKENADKIAESFKNAGGAKKAADVILNIIDG